MIPLDVNQAKSKGDMNKDIAEAVRAAVEATLNDTFGIATHMDVWSLKKGPLALEPYIVCGVDMKDAAHASTGIFVLAFSQETIAKVLEVYDSPGARDSEVINDAAEEIVNMVYGMLKTALNKMGHSFSMEIPAIVEKKQELSALYQNDTKMILPFLADGHRCKAMIVPLSD